MVKSDLVKELNCTHAKLARVGLDMQCNMRYSLDEIKKMLDDGEDYEDIIDCIEMYDEDIGDSVIHWGELNEKAAGLAMQLIKGLIMPPIEKILKFLKRKYNGRAGWK